MVPEIIEMVVDELTRRKVEIHNDLSYSEAFKLLIQEVGADAANAVLRRAVLAARTNEICPAAVESEAQLLRLEEDFHNWMKPPCLRAISVLASLHPKVFGSTVLTTNFDPLIEASFSAAGSPWYSLYLHGDGSIQYNRGSGIRIVHLHGHWFASDTLNTDQQLAQDRPKLQRSLENLLGEGTTLVVMGYGGWTDVARKAISALIYEDQNNYDILWCFRSDDQQQVADKYGAIVKMMLQAHRRGRGHCVSGVEVDAALNEIICRLRDRHPACDFFTYLEQEIKASQSDYYRWNGSPWCHSYEWPGEAIKPLAIFDSRLPALAALASVELELNRLERQPVHQAPMAQQYEWVRNSISVAINAIISADASKADFLKKCAMRAYSEKKSAKDQWDETMLRAVDLATLSSAAALLNSQELADDGYYSTETLAAKSVHVLWRMRNNDPFILKYISLRLVELYPLMLTPPA
jgi:hypothetical protein